MTGPNFRSVDVDGFEVFYREAGDPKKPALLLLHGFPTSSHMFRDLIPLLADRFHLVAPDLPGFGMSALPSRKQFTYSFDNIARVISRFTEVIGLAKFAIYIFDYGAPTGLRIAMAHPDRVTAIISQNGNAYKEGLSDGWNPIERYWRDPTDANRQALRNMLTLKSIRWQYEHGVCDVSKISPDGIVLDAWHMQRPEADEISSTCCSTTRATLSSIRLSRPISASTSPSCWRSGATRTRSSSRPALRPTSAICRTRRCGSWTRATSRLRLNAQEIAGAIADFLKG